MLALRRETFQIQVCCN